MVWRLVTSATSIQPFSIPMVSRRSEPLDEAPFCRSDSPKVISCETIGLNFQKNRFSSSHKEALGYGDRFAESPMKRPSEKSWIEIVSLFKAPSIANLAGETAGKVVSLLGYEGSADSRPAPFRRLTMQV